MNLKTDVVGIVSGAIVATISWTTEQASEYMDLAAKAVGLIAAILSVWLTGQLVRKNRLEIKIKKKKLQDE